MNASYKIVLLGAFVLFAAVVGYYVFSGDSTPDDLAAGDEYVDPAGPEEAGEQVPIPDTTRPTLVPPPVEPPAEQPPLPREETIGETPDDLPDAPVIGAAPDGESLALGGPTGERRSPEPDPIDNRGIEERTPVTEEVTGSPDEELRPAPTPDPVDSPDETTETETETETEAEPIAPPVRPVPPAPGTIPRNYTVKSGDTFASIAKEFYGEERAWFDIAQANPSVDPKRLQVGQVIVLPNRDADVREREEVRPPAPGNDQNYTVRPGDNLSKIAVKFYGDAEKWDLIYARNRKLIGTRPDALKVGMEIVIPQAYDGAE
ncbi:MAG: LysM peptidoglycan-binding domain-containing protein [Phycisphaeraceae bacterium]